MTQTLQTFKKLIAYWAIALLLVSIIGIFFTVLAWLGLVYALYQLLDGCTDVLRTCGPIYWIGKKHHKRFGVGKATMHQLSAPWLKGKGFYIAVAHMSLQIGICFPQDLDEVEGTLSAIQGRYLDIEPKEIGQW